MTRQALRDNESVRAIKNMLRGPERTSLPPAAVAADSALRLSATSPTVVKELPTWSPNVARWWGARKSKMTMAAAIAPQQPHSGRFMSQPDFG